MKPPALLLAAAALLAAAPDPVDQVRDALAAAARSPARQATAARTLAALGAHPAEGEPDLAAQWGRGEAPTPYRDRVLGPVYRRLTLSPRGNVRFEQTFYAGQAARIAVVAVDRAAFGLEVRDEDGKPLCAAPAGDCRFVPAWTARVSVALENRAARAGEFYVVMH